MNVTREDFAGTTKAKSDQMNAVDLVGGPAVFRITGIRMTGAADQPVAISVDGHPQPWKPSKTFRRVLLMLWPETEPGDWVGRDVVLWCDPDITWAGEKVGGIAISHASHIDGRKVFKLAESKSKRKTIIVEPYWPQEQAAPVDTGPVYWPDDALAKKINEAKPKIEAGERTVDQLIKALEAKAQLTAGQRARVEALGVASGPADVDQPPLDDAPPLDDDPFAE